MDVCNECGLWQYSKYPCIKGRGVLDSTTNLILIGEAPGPEEALKGEVFIGKAGRKLESMLKPFRDALNIYITNSVECYPPLSTRNPEKGFRVPKQTEIDLCRKFLLEELSNVNDNVLLMPLGNTALATILGKHEGITKVLGKFHHVRMGNNVVYAVLPNYHPSYILRNNNKRPEFERVMSIAVKYINGELNCPIDSQENNN